MGNQSCTLESSDMQFFVKTLTGKTITCEANGDDCIAYVKHECVANEGIDFSTMKFVFNGKMLEDHHCLQEIGVQQGSTLNLIMQLAGGKRTAKLTLDERKARV